MALSRLKQPAAGGMLMSLLAADKLDISVPTHRPASLPATVADEPKQ
jgi:hypothetical protein